MSDYLTKPIDDDRLHEVLSFYLEKIEATHTGDFSDKEQFDSMKNDDKKQAIELQTLLKLESLQVEGEEDIVVELIHSFLKQTPTRISSIEHSLYVELDLNNCCDEAHTIKSSARTLGAVRLGELCQKLEEMRSVAEKEKFKPLFEELKNEFNKVSSQLIDIAKSRSTSAA